jgi:poly(hydroxyalkanoate) depolymerase family esterase
MMNSTFERLMADATRLTQSGDLLAATDAIRAAMRGATVARSPAPESRDAIDDHVIEGTARRTEEPELRNPEPARTHADAVATGRIVDARHTFAAESREYKLFVPPQGAPLTPGAGKLLPLVVMLHGCTQNPDDFALGTGINEAALASTEGFFVLYPAQNSQANPSRCWNWFKRSHQQRGLGEPALLADLTRDIIERYAIDRQRVYVAGLSAGGAMAAILGAAYPDIFAAVGVHSGLAVGAAKDVHSALSAMKSGASTALKSGATTVPTIVFHGDKDSTVHPLNGEQAVLASAGSAAVRVETGTDNGRSFTRSVYAEDDCVVAEHWTIEGAGHAWSGGNAKGSYADARGPNATKEMLRFFLSNKLA